MQALNPNLHIFMLQKIYDEKKIYPFKKDNVEQLLYLTTHNFDSMNVYHKSLNSLFETYLKNNSCLIHETVRFNLLPSSKRFNLNQVCCSGNL